jgi:hypothetical protein
VFESELKKYKVIRRRAFVWKYFNKKSSARGEFKTCLKMIQTPLGSASGLMQLYEHPFAEIYCRKLFAGKSKVKETKRGRQLTLGESF